MEAYIDVFFVIRNVVLLSQSTEVPAFFAGREALFHHFPVYGNAECVFPVLLLPVPVQLVGNARIPAEDIGKEKLYFIYTLGAVEANNLLSSFRRVWNKGSVCPCFGFRFVQFPPYRRCIPNCLRHKAGRVARSVGFRPR